MPVQCAGLWAFAVRAAVMLSLLVVLRAEQEPFNYSKALEHSGESGTGSANVIDACFSNTLITIATEDGGRVPTNRELVYVGGLTQRQIECLSEFYQVSTGWFLMGASSETRKAMFEQSHPWGGLWEHSPVFTSSPMNVTKVSTGMKNGLSVTGHGFTPIKTNVGRRTGVCEWNVTSQCSAATYKTRICSPGGCTKWALRPGQTVSATIGETTWSEAWCARSPLRSNRRRLTHYSSGSSELMGIRVSEGRTRFSHAFVYSCTAVGNFDEPHLLIDGDDGESGRLQVTVITVS